MKVIRCPHCGAEYLPSEIFMPEDFLESPSDIFKTDEGTIKDANVEEACLVEDYICDFCNKKFTVRAQIDFNVDGLEFDEDEYVTRL